MKKTIVALLIMLALVSCGSPADAATNDSDEMFVTVEQGWDYRVVYCRTNRVMYAVSCAYSNSGNFTLLVNPDKSPMLYGLDYHEGLE